MKKANYIVAAVVIMSLLMLATISGLRTLANTQGALDRITTRIDEVRTVSVRFLLGLLLMFSASMSGALGRRACGACGRKWVW